MEARKLWNPVEFHTVESTVESGLWGPRLGKWGVRGVQRGFLWRNLLIVREKDWTPRGVSRVCPVEGFDDITP